MDLSFYLGSALWEGWGAVYWKCYSGEYSYEILLLTMLYVRLLKEEDISDTAVGIDWKWGAQM